MQLRQAQFYRTSCQRGARHAIVSSARCSDWQTGSLRSLRALGAQHAAGFSNCWGGHITLEGTTQPCSCDTSATELFRTWRSGELARLNSDLACAQNILRDRAAAATTGGRWKQAASRCAQVPFPLSSLDANTAQKTSSHRYRSKLTALALRALCRPEAMPLNANVCCRTCRQAFARASRPESRQRRRQAGRCTFVPCATPPKPDGMIGRDDADADIESAERLARSKGRRDGGRSAEFGEQRGFAQDNYGVAPPPEWKEGKLLPEGWDEMDPVQKVGQVWAGERGLLFWINKAAYASVFVVIGLWIVFRFVGPSLGLYELSGGPPQQ